MKKRLREFFSTTRAERRGYAFLLALMAAGVCIMLMVKCGGKESVGADIEAEVEKTEQLADSIDKIKADTVKAKRKQRRDAKKKTAKPKTKKIYEDRPIEEVPQY